MRSEGIKEAVKDKYGEIARSVASGAAKSCCGGESSCGADPDPITGNLYAADERAVLPEKAVLASLGCGNPTALAQLHAGDTVLDLGSGGGIDVLLSARRVGPTGKAYGLDMSEDMLALARENQHKAGVENVEFLKGEIENIPLPDNSVDVIISNCVINLSADKDRVLGEAFRVLKPGGRFAVSDVVVRGTVPSEIRRRVELWIGCVAGALEETEYRSKLRSAGFEAVEVEPTRIYYAEDAREILKTGSIEVEAIAPQVDGKFMSAFIRARKPIHASSIKTVLFACVQNAGRSQMAAAWFNKLADPHRAQALSAGTKPANHVHPAVVAAMREVGIDLSNAKPQLLTPELGRAANLLVTMGCGDGCPYVPGLKIEDWPLPDPKDQPVEAVRKIRDDIRVRVERLIAAEALK